MVSKAWILFFRARWQGPCFTATEEDGGDKRLEELELACEADGERGDKKGKDGMGGEQRTKGEERTGDRSREEAAARKQGRRREHR